MGSHHAVDALPKTATASTRTAITSLRGISSPSSGEGFRADLARQNAGNSRTNIPVCIHRTYQGAKAALLQRLAHNGQRVGVAAPVSRTNRKEKPGTNHASEDAGYKGLSNASHYSASLHESCLRPRHVASGAGR